MPECLSTKLEGIGLAMAYSDVITLSIFKYFAANYHLPNERIQPPLDLPNLQEFHTTT